MQAIKMYDGDALANLPAGKFSTVAFIHEFLFRDIEIKRVLSKALTNNIADRLTYMKGLDVSYHIEGYNAYKAEELLMCRAQLYHFDYTIIIKI